MTLFLTSSPSGCPFEPGPEVPVLDAHNGFVEALRAAWPTTPPRGLALAADPDAHAGNDQMCRVFLRAFADAGVPLAEFVPVDSRNAGQLDALLAASGFVMLCGGHVPTQNRFFAQIGLAERLRGYPGIVLGVSAGTMNAARLVYAQPEEEGEAADPAFRRWLPGLGLTETCVLPHFECIRSWTVDGQRVEDMARADSFAHPILALPDGSYLLSAHGRETLHGPAVLFEKGESREVQG